MIWLASFLYLICCTLAFAYGAHVSFNKGGVLFLQVITCAFGCFTLGSVYDLCYFLCIGEYKNGFGIGDLGYIGGMTFLFSSYYGAMDRIGDSGSKSLIKFRIIACIPGVLNAFLCLFLILLPRVKAIFIISTVLISMVSYFSLKHLILPDIKDGILSSMRLYNFTILLMCIFKDLHIVSYIFKPEISGVFEAALGIITLLTIPIANRGVKKWYI